MKRDRNDPEAGPIRISKLLSLALRHRPEALGLALDDRGYARVPDVLIGLARAGFVLSEEDLFVIVRASDKRRFALSEDRARIRANQGHSVEVDLALPSREPPPELHHGTVRRFLPAILREGLVRRGRTHVHLSTDRETAEIVARRREGDVVILLVRAEAMSVQGHRFFQSENGVWLTEHVPPEFLFVL